MSYQNIGNSWKVGTANPPTTVESELAQQEIALPQYFRLGLSYTMRVVPADPGGLSPFGVMIAVDAPFLVSFEYAVIPLYQLDYWARLGGEKSSVPVFSIGIGYTGYPW